MWIYTGLPAPPALRVVTEWWPQRATRHRPQPGATTAQRATRRNNAQHAARETRNSQLITHRPAARGSRLTARNYVTATRSRQQGRGQQAAQQPSSAGRSSDLGPAVGSGSRLIADRKYRLASYEKQPPKSASRSLRTCIPNPQCNIQYAI
jgi:hypothetical protein